MGFFNFFTQEIAIDLGTANTIIICNDKSRPKKEDITRLLDLIEMGYGFVGLYAWGYFGFKKDLFRVVGFMDERFIGGNYEDSDYMYRMLESNISMYNILDIKYKEEIPSGWDTSRTRSHFLNKWEYDNGNGTIKRLLSEENYPYNIGEKTNDQFLPWESSILSESQFFVKYKLIEK